MRGVTVVLALAAVGCQKENSLHNGVGDWGGDWGEAQPVDSEPVEVCDAALAEPVTLTMSADDSNSQATPVLARSIFSAGQVYAGPIFPWEFLNYYRFSYTAPEQGLELYAGALLDESDPDALELVVAVVAPEVTEADRRPLNLVFSVDVSGSMGGAGLARAKDTMRALASQLRSGDTVSVVTWDTSISTVLEAHAVSGPDDAELLEAVDGMESGGSTDLSQGLEAAYALAALGSSEGLTRRVVLISDGGANTGVTDETLIGGSAEGREDEAIYLIGVGVGAASMYNGQLMDTVTDMGRGAHVFIDSAAEARHQFGDPERFAQNLLVAATDVTLRMDLPAGWVVERFSGEQISTDPAEVVPQNLAPNDQMLYHLTLRNCGGDAEAPFAFAAAYNDLDGAAHTVTLSTDPTQMKSSYPAATRKAVALVDAAEALRDLADQSDEELGAVRDATQATAEAQHGDPDLLEVVSMLDAAITLRGETAR